MPRCSLAHNRRHCRGGGAVYGVWTAAGYQQIGILGSCPEFTHCAFRNASNMGVNMWNTTGTVTFAHCSITACENGMRLHDERFRIDVLDLSGRSVATLADRDLTAGPQTVAWRGCDTRGHALPAGIYLVRVAGDTDLVMRKVTLLR